MQKRWTWVQPRAVRTQGWHSLGVSQAGHHVLSHEVTAGCWTCCRPPPPLRVSVMVPTAQVTRLGPREGTTAHPQVQGPLMWGSSKMHRGYHRQSPPGSKMLDVPFWKPLPVGVPGTHTPCLQVASGRSMENNRKPGRRLPAFHPIALGQRFPGSNEEILQQL